MRLAAVARPGAYAASLNRYVTGPVLGAAWALTLVVLLWIALTTTSLAAWVAWALAVVMPALAMMVLAQTPAKTIAEIIRDA